MQQKVIIIFKKFFMSDSIKKWHEMQEDKAEREKQEIKKKAYSLLTEYGEDVIRTALEILKTEKLEKFI